MAPLHEFDLSTAPRGVEAGGHVAGYAAVELVSGDTTQLRENCLAQFALRSGTYEIGN